VAEKQSVSHCILFFVPTCGYMYKVVAVTNDLYESTQFVLPTNLEKVIKNRELKLLITKWHTVAMVLLIKG
jgi:hypothetical protein